jgi:FHA domain
MSNDQRTVGVGSGGGWPPDSESGPTQLAGSGSGMEDRPTPKTIPAEDLGAWPPAPPPPPPPPAPDVSPFRPTSEPAPGGPPPQPAQATGGKTMLMRTEPEPQIPLAWLAVVEGPGGKRGTVFTLKSETILGRAYGDLVLSGDPTVSSQHAKVRLEAKEESAEGEQIFVVYDLASANGTFVGTKQTYRDEDSRIYRRELMDGDYILVGETTLVFKHIDK